MESVTCYTVIGDNLRLLQWCISNARARAGVPHEWLVVNWRTAGVSIERYEAVERWCATESVRVFVHQAEEQPQEAALRTRWFLNHLYASFNAGYEAARTKWVARLGSDQFFGHDWLKWLFAPVEHFGERATYHTWTVESPQAIRSRHPVMDFGTTPETFNEMQFDQYADHLIHKHSSRYLLKPSETRLYYRHPARGLQLRVDGVTWLQTKALWDEFGPLRDDINPEGVTGDVDYMDRLFDAGVPAYLVAPSVSFHLVRGESRDVQA